MEEKRFLYRSANHAANLNQMRLNNKWCDVTIKVSEKEFSAHKVVLAANLKYFDTMLSNDSFKESKQDVISMKGFEGADLEIFVSYAYTGEILLTDSNALDVLELANYLGEDDIKDACIKFLEKYLRKEEACRAYKFSDNINCTSLKDVARQIISLNFVDCSQTADYLNLDYENLMGIFIDVKDQPAELQQKYFEGIMRWVMHNLKERRIRMNDLLNSIDMAKLSSDGLIDYLFGNVVDPNDKNNIVKDVMSCYCNNKGQQMKCQSLMIVGFNNEKFNFQTCDLTKRKWSPLNEIPHFHEFQLSIDAVLNNEFYYISVNRDETYLNVFSPTSKRISTLNISSSILRCSCMCACSRFLYLCGGNNKNGFTSNQALKYDPLTNSFESLPPMRTERSSAAAIFYQGCLLVLGGWRHGNLLNSVDKYDPNTKQWTAFPSMCESRGWQAMAILNGKLYACGGRSDKNSVEVYDPSKNCWQLVANMNKERDIFLVAAHEGKLLAIGGDGFWNDNWNNTVEVYDPDKDEWQLDHELSSSLRLHRARGKWISFNYNVDANQHFRSSET